MVGVVKRPMASISREWMTSIYALTARERLRSGFVTLGAGFVIALSFLLVPDARGHGTHEQLGLPPCMTLRTFGFPCPFCGMTTAFVYMAHGHLLQAFQTQPAGALAFPMAFAFALFHAGEASLGRSLEPLKRASTRRILWRTGIAMVALAWIYKLATSF